LPAFLNEATAFWEPSPLQSAAYEQGASQNVLQMFTLFGDPAISLKWW